MGFFTEKVQVGDYERVGTNRDGDCSALFAPLKYPFVLDAPNGDRHGRGRRRSMTMTLTDQVRFPLGCRRLSRGSERTIKRPPKLGLARENIVNVATAISSELSMPISIHITSED